MKRWYMTIIGTVVLIGMGAAVLIVRPDSFQEFASFVTPTIVALLALKKAEEAAHNTNGSMHGKIKTAVRDVLNERAKDNSNEL